MTASSSKASRRMMSDLHHLCDFGGRLSGSRSEAAARDWLISAGEDAMGVPVHRHEVAYEGWRATHVALEISGKGPVPAHPLLKSAATPIAGIEAEVIDLGRGVEEDFDRVGDRIHGKIAMVRHEVMFSSGTFHRRRKLQLALARGAVAVLVVSRTPGEPVTGSARATEATLPALGITPETAQLLQRDDGQVRRAKIVVETEEAPAIATNLVFDRLGISGKTVVLSAHYDGHDLGESALDNASGVVACLEVARSLAAARTHHGLRLIFFTVEEWGLLGSHQYLCDLKEAERQKIILNANADTVVGGNDLTVMTSGFKSLSRWMQDWAKRSGTNLTVFEPFQANSDNASFARFGIPALRLVSGFNEPNATVKYVLTRTDTRELVVPSELEHATSVLQQITRKALDASDVDAARWTKMTDEPQGA